jgi:Collagen triple helix repeat (20 copies)
MRGEQGERGLTGERGLAGERGERGERGHRGTTGLRRVLLRDSPLAYFLAALTMLGALVTGAMEWKGAMDEIAHLRKDVDELRRDHVFHWGKEEQ